MSALGTEFKLNIHLEPIDGLHMSGYDFEVDLYVYTNKRVTFSKMDMKKVDDDNYLIIVTTADAMKIGRGKINAEVRAYIPDGDFPDGTRTEVLLLCTNQVVV